MILTILISVLNKMITQISSNNEYEQDDIDDIDDIYNIYEDDIYEDKSYIYTGSESCPIYTKHHAIPRSGERTIRPYLVKLGLPTNIINSACKIHQNMNVGTRRGKRLRMLIFFCTFTAYSKESITVDPVKLAKICNIERSSISKSLSMCSTVNTQYTTPLVRYTPRNYIPIYYKKLNDVYISFPDEALENIYVMTDEIMNKDPDLKDEKPQTVAAAILVFYLQINGYTIEKTKYNSIFNRSDMTINKIKKRVKTAYNI